MMKDRVASPSPGIASVVFDQIGGLVALPAVPDFVSHVALNGDPLFFATERFWDAFFGVEECVGELTVVRRRSPGFFFAEPVLTELRRYGRAEISLAHVHEFLKIVPTFCEFYIFFIADKTQQVRCVDAYWFHDRWNLDASPITTAGINTMHRIVSPVSR